MRRAPADAKDGIVDIIPVNVQIQISLSIVNDSSHSVIHPAAAASVETFLIFADVNFSKIEFFSFRTCVRRLTFQSKRGAFKWSARVQLLHMDKLDVLRFELIDSPRIQIFCRFQI